MFEGEKTEDTRGDSKKAEAAAWAGYSSREKAHGLREQANDNSRMPQEIENLLSRATAIEKRADEKEFEAALKYELDEVIKGRSKEELGRMRYELEKLQGEQFEAKGDLIKGEDESGEAFKERATQIDYNIKLVSTLLRQWYNI